MSYDTRKVIYKEIEVLRRKPLLVYVNSVRSGMSGSMDLDVLPYMIKQIEIIRNNDEFKDCKEIDLLILSNGGDPITSWRLITLLREFYKKITILIPYVAYSAATLLALGADEIIIHPYGNLGPLDPQISLTVQNIRKTISYEDIVKYLDFVRDVGITDQDLVQKSFEKLTNEINPTSLGFAKRSSQLGLTMGEKLLSLHMSDKNKARAISETLNTKFYNHGYSLGKTEAEEIGLKIVKNDEIEKKIWSIAEDFIDDYCMNQPINFNSFIKSEIKISELENDKIYDRIDEYKLTAIESLRLKNEEVWTIKTEFKVNTQEMDLRLATSLITKWK